MRVRKKFKRRSEKGKLLSRIDSLFRKVILLDRPARCEKCGKHTVVSVSHILPKGTYPRLRYCPGNVLLLCVACHLYWWHKNPIEAKAWLDKYKGKDWVAGLKILDRAYPKLNAMQLEMYKTAFEAQLNGKNNS